MELPYLYQDLEPYIDTHTVGLHYLKHQKNYLNKLNSLLLKNNYDFRYTLDELIYHINEFPVGDREDILYNLGGVLNHNLYWKSINKNKKEPIGNLKRHIDSKYRSFDKFFDEVKKRALEIKGSGYTFLVLRNDGDLDIINFYNQDNPLSFGYIPLFTIDMWEHAYYLNYKNEKEKYLDNIKEIVDFTNASNIYNNIVKN